MSWNNLLGLWLIGGFIVYLISANRMNAYLALFTSTAVSYNAAPPTIPSGTASAAPTTTTPTAAAAAPNTVAANGPSGQFLTNNAITSTTFGSSPAVSTFGGPPNTAGIPAARGGDPAWTGTLTGIYPQG